MRKNILSLSIAAMIGGIGFAGVASASVLNTNTVATNLQVTPGGTGHILLVPYFSAQGGNATLVNMVNTDQANGKEVKVRFRGASNSDDILDYTLYLSPGDMYAFKVYQGPNNTATLITGDKSCTMPSFIGVNNGSGTSTAGTDFKTARLQNGTLVSPTAAQTATMQNETREGYIEILNTADIPKALQPGQSNVGGTVTTNPLFTAIKHVAGVPPCTSGTLTALASTDFARNVSVNPAGTAAPGGENAASTSGLTNPTGGLFANATIINVGNTVTFTQTATALVANTGAGTVSAAANLVHSPQLDVANGGGVAANGGSWTGLDATPPVRTPVNTLTADALLRSANVARANATVDLAVSILTAAFQDLPDLSTPYVTAPGAALAPLTQAATLTAAIAAKSVNNEYETLTALNAATDWVFSMPTRRYSVAMDYAWVAARGGSDGRVFTDLTGGVPVAAANAAVNTPSAALYFGPGNTSVATNGYQICTNGDANKGLVSFDREETTAAAAITASPGNASQLLWCGETSVIAFNVPAGTTSSVLNATVAPSFVTVVGQEGWARIGTLGAANVAVPGIPVVSAQYNGLPVMGAYYTKFLNNNLTTGTGASAVAATYGEVAVHRYTY